MAYLAVPIAAKDFEQASGQIDSAISAGAEMLELRTDYLQRLNVDLVKKIAAHAKNSGGGALPLIVTCRDIRQGGARDYPVELRIDVLVTALKAGVEFVDFEYENFLVPTNQGRIKVALSESLKGRLILSAHNFKGKFENISRLHRHIQTLYSAAIPKLVYTANHINDCFEAFDLLHSTGPDRIILCMGKAGLISRIIAGKLDNFLTFASVEEKKATAPGQLTIEMLKGQFRYDTIDADTELYGVIASPVAHSMSPAVHNACFEQIGANKLYLPLLVEGGKDEFDEFMNSVLSRPWLGFKGFSVTLPHKHNALDYAKAKGYDVEFLAERIGAVNTLLISDKPGVYAGNTDFAGALDSITDAMEIADDALSGMSVAVVGAGGVSRAVVAGLSGAGAKVKIYNRTVEKAAMLAEEFDCEFAGSDQILEIDAELLINCTSIGMYPDIQTSPVPSSCLKGGMTVFDTVYNPVKTLLLSKAKQAGAKTIDGLTMFVNQACAQFSLFTGQQADPALMRNIVLEKLSFRGAK
ncbi:shikimate dehydrogenase [Planctomycetota bacterium]